MWYMQETLPFTMLKISKIMKLTYDSSSSREAFMSFHIHSWSAG